MRHLNTSILAAILVAAFAFPASAQTQIPFQLRVQQDTAVTTIANGGTVSFTVPDVSQSASATITATYKGLSTATVSQLPTLIGSTAFKISGFPALPVVLNPNDSFSFTLTFTAPSGTQATAQLSLPYSESPQTGATVGASGTINLSLLGTAPQFVVSYVFSSNGNVFPLTSGQTISFPPTLTGGSTTVVISIVNRGSGPGVVSAVTINGTAFSPLGLPLLPLTLEPGQQTQFSINYSPQQQGTDTGTAQITFGNRTFNIGLSGTATGASFTYELLLGTETIVVAPGTSVALPDVRVGDNVSAALRIRNTGNGSGTVTSINLIGTGFQLSNVPILPQVLAPNASTLVTVTFAPTQPGLAKAQMRIGSDSFEITGNGIGPKLVYSYGAGSSATDVLPSGSVLFSPLPVGQKATQNFHITNTGTASTTIQAIGVIDPKSPFTIAALPNLPLQLDPGASADFSIAFAPTTTGFSNATLRIDSQTFTLTGAATAPPALPAYSLSGPSGTIDALQQPAVGLSLAATYPIDINGSLNLSFVPTGFSGDPAIQFSTGGTSATFTIPANTTDAVFTNGSKQIRFQTGSVAGALTITPSFATSGGVDLTPSSPRSLQLTVPPAAPRILSVQVTPSSNGFTLAINGISTPKDLRRVDFQFTASPGFTVPQTQFSIDIGSAAATWYLNPQSVAFGSQFLISVPFSLEVTQGSTVSINALQSVSVTITNSQGTSAAVSANLR